MGKPKYRNYPKEPRKSREHCSEKKVKVLKLIDGIQSLLHKDHDMREKAAEIITKWCSADEKKP